MRSFHKYLAYFTFFVCRDILEYLNQSFCGFPLGFGCASETEIMIEMRLFIAKLGLSEECSSEKHHTELLLIYNFFGVCTFLVEFFSWHGLGTTSTYRLSQLMMASTSICYRDQITIHFGVR